MVGDLPRTTIHRWRLGSGQVQRPPAVAVRPQIQPESAERGGAGGREAAGVTRQVRGPGGGCAVDGGVFRTGADRPTAALVRQWLCLCSWWGDHQAVVVSTMAVLNRWRLLRLAVAALTVLLGLHLLTEVTEDTERQIGKLWAGKQSRR